VSSAATALAPQCGQNCEPTNIEPRHDAQAMVASREPQYAHIVASLAHGAPQLGQFRDEGMLEDAED
jgi:hypothetical protein